MTPDEYRKKYKSCLTCEYYQKHKVLTTILEKCLVKNRKPIAGEAKKCKVYKPILFKESETNES